MLSIDPGDRNGFCCVCWVFLVILAVPKVVGCDGVLPVQIVQVFWWLIGRGLGL